MNLTPDQYDQIEAYVNGQLSESSRQAFEDELKQNPQLYAEAKIQRDLLLGLRDIGIRRTVEAARERYKAVETYTDTESKGRIIAFGGTARHMPLRYLSVAASVLLLLGSGWWIWQTQQTTRTEEIAIAERKLSDTQLKLLSLDSLKVAVKNPHLVASRQRIEWYLAQKYLQAGKTTQARTILIRISLKPGHPYQASARELLQKLPKQPKQN